MTEPVREYHPRGSALELFKSRDREVLLSGAAGTGKSRGCLELLHARMLKYEGSRGVIIRKTAVSLSSTALATFKEFVAKEHLASGQVRFYGGSSDKPPSFQYSNGSMIVIAGMDKATKIMSSEYDLAYCQEATELSEDDWEMITTRLRHGVLPLQQIIADCNPDAPHHWLKQRCDSGRTKIIYCRHEDNPVLWNGENWTDAGTSYMQTLDALSGVRKERLRYGKWSAADGLIFDEFDSRVHLRDPFSDRPPVSWPRYWSIDFGYRNPTVVQFWCVDKDGCLILFRELYCTGMLPEEVAEAVKKMRKNKGTDEPDPVAVITDHDADGRVVLERKLGISTIAAHKSVLEGIEAVQARLKVSGNGKPGLMICRDAVTQRDPVLLNAKKPASTQEEVLEYAWENPVSGKPVKEAPRKVNDHGMDAMRYLVAHLDLQGKPNIRFVDMSSSAMRRTEEKMRKRREDKIIPEEAWHRVG